MKTIIKTLWILYFSTLFYIFFLARRRPHPTLFQHAEPVNLIPLKDKLSTIPFYYAMTAPEKWNFITDLFGNIALFIPLPFFLIFIYNIKENWKIVLIGFAISFCVELTQFILSIGVADIDDIILNTLGTCLGLVCYRMYKKISRNYSFNW